MTPSEEHSSTPPDPNAFDPDEKPIEERLEQRNELAEALTQHGFPDTLLLARERAPAIFHERRLELIDYLREHEPRSVRALATALDLDKGVVSRDLQELARLDVVEYETDGRSKAPRLKHRHVAVEPIY